MKVLNFGSLNLDYVYSVDHMVAEGETLAAGGMNTFCGGKGLNQSIALAKAGVPVYHAGLIGEEGKSLLDACRENGVHTDFIREIPGKSGHTIIQVDKSGQNCILLYGGANRSMTREFIDEVLSHFEKGDYLLLQNEVNLVDYMVDQAYQKGMEIILNPSPFDRNLEACDLSKISLFLMNEIEGWQITGEKEPERIQAGHFSGGDQGYHGGRGYLYRVLYLLHDPAYACPGRTGDGGKGGGYCGVQGWGHRIHTDPGGSHAVSGGVRGRQGRGGAPGCTI